MDFDDEPDSPKVSPRTLNQHNLAQNNRRESVASNVVKMLGGWGRRTSTMRPTSKEGGGRRDSTISRLSAFSMLSRKGKDANKKHSGVQTDPTFTRTVTKDAGAQTDSSHLPASGSKGPKARPPKVLIGKSPRTSRTYSKGLPLPDVTPDGGRALPQNND